MKKIKFLLVACLLGIAATASAQFANSKSSSNGGSGNSSSLENWQSIKVSYMPVTFDGDGGGEINLNGAMLSYQKGFIVSQETPIFVETGLGVSWIGGEVEDTDIDLNFFSLNVPVNLGYKLAINDGISISPFLGITLRGNLFGKYKYEDESIDAFDDELDGAQLKRFNFGWQIGLGVNINSLYIGASYGSDFNEIIEKGKGIVPQITLGYNF